MTLFYEMVGDVAVSELGSVRCLPHPKGPTDAALLEGHANKRGVREWQNRHYAYGLWPSGHVRRRHIKIWKVQGGRSIPMEKHSSKDESQTEISPFSTETIQIFKDAHEIRSRKKTAVQGGES